MKDKKQPCVTCGKKIEPVTDFICHYCGRLPITMDLFDAMDEMAKLTVKLNDKINRLRQFFDTLNLPHDDERNQFLGSISMLSGWLNIQLIIYRDYARGTNSPIGRKIRESNQNMALTQFTEIIRNFDLVNRRSYLTSFMFQVEVFLERINGILPNVATEQGYKKLVKHVLKELGMTQKDNEKYRILYFPALVRNSLHMNGTHMGDDDNGKIQNIPFSFKNKQLVGHAGWRHMYFFCEHILDVIEEILKNKQIGNIYIQSIHPIAKTY